MNRLPLAIFLCFMAASAQAWFRHAEPYPPIDAYFAATGNDLNPCTISQPCLTIAKANTLTYGSGSTLNFHEGDTFSSAVGLALKGPLVAPTNTYGSLTVSTYGGGTCAPIAGTISGCATIQLTGSTEVNGIFADTDNNVTVHNMRVIGGAAFIAAFQQTNGIYVRNGTGANGSVTITNNEVIDMSNLINVNTIVGSHSNDVISDNYLHGSTLTTTIDNGIWTQGNVLNITIEGNLVENIGGHNSSVGGHFYIGGSGNGILISARGNGAIDEFNVTEFIGNNLNTCGGPVGNWDYNTSNVIVAFNESAFIGPTTRAPGTCDFGGFDIDGGSVGVVQEYNYAHDTLGEGYGYYIAAANGQLWSSNVSRYNIAEENQAGNPNAGQGYLFSGANQSYDLKSAVYNNTFATNYDAPGTSGTDGLCVFFVFSSNIIWANNICYNSGATGGDRVFVSTAPPAGLLQLANNDYFRSVGSSVVQFYWNGATYSSLAAFQAATPGVEVGSVAVDPQLTAPNAGGSCWTSGIPTGPQPCPSAYVLQAGSPMIGTGLDMQAAYGFNPGTRDYYGNTIPNGVGTGFNIGADGGNP